MDPQDLEDDAVEAASELLRTVDDRLAKAKTKTEGFAKSGAPGPKGPKDRTLKVVEATNRQMGAVATDVSVLARIIRDKARKEATATALVKSDNKKILDRMDKQLKMLTQTLSKPLKIQAPKVQRARVTGPESRFVKRAARIGAGGAAGSGGILDGLGSGLGLAEAVLGLLGVKGLMGKKAPGKAGMISRVLSAGRGKVGTVMKLGAAGAAAASAGAAAASSGAAAAVDRGKELVEKGKTVVANAANSEGAKNAISAASAAPKTGMVGAAFRKLPVLGSLLTAASVYESESSNATRQEKNENLGGIGGSLAGGWAGAKLGAGAGAAIGSFVPVIGTAVGGVAGAVIGGIGGSLLGDKAGRALVPASNPGALDAERQERAIQNRVNAIETSVGAQKALMDRQIEALERNTDKMESIEKGGWLDKLSQNTQQLRTAAAVATAKAGRWIADTTDAGAAKVEQWTAAPEGANSVRKAIASGGRAVADKMHSGAGRTREQTERSANAIAGDGGGLAQLIARHESGGAGYNAYNTGTVGQGKEKLDLENMTIGELKRRQALPKGDPNRIFAAGKYQAIPGTLKEAQSKLGFTDDQKFTKELQDQIFTDHLVGAKRKEIQDYVTGKSDNLVRAEDGLAKEFASMYSPTKGKGWYDGDSAGNKASGRADSQLKAARAAYQENVAKGMTEQDAYRASILNSNEPGAAPGTPNQKVIEAQAKANAEAGQKVAAATPVTAGQKGLKPPPGYMVDPVTRAIVPDPGLTAPIVPNGLPVPPEYRTLERDQAKKAQAVADAKQPILDKNGKLRTDLGKGTEKDPAVAEALALAAAPASNQYTNDVKTPALPTPDLKAKTAQGVAAPVAKALAQDQATAASQLGQKQAKMAAEAKTALAPAVASAAVAAASKPVINEPVPVRAPEKNDTGIITAIQSLERSIVKEKGGEATVKNQDAPTLAKSGPISLETVPSFIDDLGLVLLSKGV